MSKIRIKNKIESNINLKNILKWIVYIKLIFSLLNNRFNYIVGKKIKYN